MSLEYYLLCKEKYEFILKYLEGVDDLFNQIIDITHAYNETEYNFILVQENKNFFLDRQKHITQLKNTCDNKIYKLCVHDFVEDSIDISPDKSKNIRYCKICQYTYNK